MAAIDDIFRALADPGRRELLDRLHACDGQSLTSLAEGMAMTRQAVTQHLRVLEDANLVAVRWRGREKLHFFNPVPIHDIYERWIRKYEQSRLSALHHLKTTLEGDSHGDHDRGPDPAARVRDLHRDQR